jgi:hypothetical protein
MMDKKYQTIEYPKSKDGHAPYGNSKNYFLEYELDLEIEGDYFATLEGP